MSEQTFEDHIKDMVSHGYITGNGTPLKCHYCESKNLKEVNFNDGPHTVEVDVTCKDCGKHVGNWSYGNWSI